MKKILIGVAALAWVLPLAAQTVTLDAQSQNRAGIVVRPVLERSFGVQIRVVGQVVRAPGSTLTLKSILPGRVEKLDVAPGDEVRAGTVLVELHSHEMLGMQGDLLRAHDRSGLAESRLEAGRELYRLQGISRIELQTREQAAFAAELELERLKREMVDLGLSSESVEALVVNREADPHVEVVSPSNAVVLEMMVQQHQWVQPFEPLLVLGDPGRVELELQIPPGEAAGVAEGSLVEFVPVGRPRETARARVVSRVPQVDPETRTVRVRARILDSGKAAIFPGVFVEGTITQGDPRQAPSVPESAVIRLGANDVVFVRTAPDSFDSRPVELGLFNGSRYEVLSGVEIDEEVVVQGVFFLKSVAVTGEAE